MPRPDYSRPALPLRTEGQKAHDEVYDIIDEKGRHTMGSVETAPTSRSRGMTGLESPGLSGRGEDVGAWTQTPTTTSRPTAAGRTDA